MQRFAILNKEIGETPLEALERWRVTKGISPSVPLAYAGRLDPMASGKLLVLIGDECKRQKAYHGFDKAYRFEVLLGFRTDTGDILGLAERTPVGNLHKHQIRSVIMSLTGTHSFRYPRFSSKTVRGTPLHEWTLRGGLPDSDIPSYTAQVKKIRMHGVRLVSAQEIHASIQERINRIPPVTDPRKALGADFRRGTILPRWDILLTNTHEQFIVIEATAVVSSGTYIRTLAEEIGRRLSTGALAYSIHRTHIGTYRSLPFMGGFWTHTW